MKAVFIVYNQANTERVDYMLDRLGIRGFTTWEQVNGRGSVSGEPRMGTHTWPEMNSATLTIIREEQVEELLSYIKSSTNATRTSVSGLLSGILNKLSKIGRF